SIALVVVLLAAALWRLSRLPIDVRWPRHWTFLQSATFVLAAAVILYMIAVKFSPEHTADAELLYQPYYQEVLDTGRIAWPTPYTTVYFIAKNAGFHFLFSAVSDVHSVELISIFYVGLAVASLICILAAVLPGASIVLWPTALLFL